MPAGRGKQVRPAHPTVQKATPKSMSDRTILLVEDKPDDVGLTLMALTRVTGANNIIIAHDCAHGSAHDTVKAKWFLAEPETSPANPGTLPTLIVLELNVVPASHAANSS
jgi:hypothetical protein